MFYQNIKILQIENTSICNAACPMCLREQKPNDKSWLEESYLETDFFDRIPSSIWNGLEFVEFNGTIGDPCAAPNFIEVCNFIKNKNPNIKLNISTNGGLRNEKFWIDLAECLSEDDTVTFAIDGLEDTNHIYRVNVNYQSVIKNAKTFISHNGVARWQFITFKHNEHQIDEAKSIAEQLGFKHFFIKPSYRFILDDLLGIDRYGASGILIEPPTKENNIHPLVFVKKKFNIDQWKESSNTSKINCYAKRSQSAYIDYKGRLFPCCPLSAGVIIRNSVTLEDDWNRIWKEHGEEKINLHFEEWDNIVNGMLFECVQNSWDKDYKTGRLLSCAGTCSDSSLQFNKR